MKLKEWLQAASDYLDVRRTVSPLADSQKSLDDWFHSAHGQFLLQRERQALEQLIPQPGAHRMLYLGASSCRLLPGDYNHLHSFCFSASSTAPGSASAVADFDALPLPSETVDTVLLHHALEFSEYPHEVLSEVSRVLTPCGQAIIVVLNPSSLFGLGKWPARLFLNQVALRHHSLRYRRLLDWMRLLNLQPETAVSGCYSWPLYCGGSEDTDGIIEKAGQKIRLPWGAFYIVRARKYTARMTPLRPQLWRSISAPLIPNIEKTALRIPRCQEKDD